MQEIAERIRELRMRKGWTQQELADKCGYKSRSAINKIERNTYEIGLETLKRIATALGVSPNYLVFGDRPIKDEINLLFDRLTPEQQESVLAFLRSMIAERETNG